MGLTIFLESRKIGTINHSFSRERKPFRMLRFVSSEDSEMSIEELLLQENPQAILIEEFRDCIIGVNRGNNLPVAVYDYWSCIEVLQENNGIDQLDAIQSLQEMVLEGENKPIFVQIADEVWHEAD